MDEPSRPRWRKKWVAAGAVALLIVAYPVSVGPAAYCVERGWLSNRLFAAACAPALNALPSGSAARAEYATYLNWWLELAGEHDGHREFWMFP
jgi:hypothetical protein